MSVQMAVAKFTAVGVTAFLLGSNLPHAAQAPRAHQAAIPAPRVAVVAAASAPATPTGRPLDVTVVATEFKLAPSPLTVRAGQLVRLTFVNKGAAIHNWAVQGLPANRVRLLSSPKDLAAGLAAEMRTSIAHSVPFAEAGPGERAVVEFVPLKAGSYVTRCTIPGHAAMGMTARLIVTGQTPAGQTNAAAPVAQPASSRTATTAAPRLPLPRVAPPVGTRGPRFVHVTLEAKEVTGYLDDGVSYTFWTFNGTVPGPMIRVRVGDTVEVTLKNAPSSMMSHSIDLHAVSGPGGGSVATNVAPGQSASFTFKALNAGVYIYHCATAPVAEHISNGMYGMIVVEPAGGLPKVSREFYVMEGEIYTAAKGSGTFSMPRMRNEDPSYVVLNGSVGALMGTHALQTKVGETVRLFFGVGGPNLTSSLHVIGAIFDRAAPDGSFDWEHNVGVTMVPAGGATIVEFTPREPGHYMIVDHSLSRALLGAVGDIHVTGAANPAIYHAAPGDHIVESMKH